MTLPEQPPVTLTRLTADNWSVGLGTLDLAVSPSQQHFVSEHVPTAAIMMAKAYIRPAGLTWVPFLIEHAGEAVGMLQLVYGSDEHSECWLYHFFIDQRYQRRGLGSSAMRAFLDLVGEVRPGAPAVCLTVHPDNVVAQGLYQRLGFVAMGEVRDGEAVYRLARG